MLKLIPVLTILFLLLRLLFLYPPIILLVLVVSMVLSETQSLMFSFIIGLITDCLSASSFGEHALIYVSLSMLIILYRRKISITSVWFILGLSLLVGIFDSILAASWSVAAIALSPAIVFPLLLLLRRVVRI